MAYLKFFLILCLITLSLQGKRSASASGKVFSLPEDKDKYEITVPAGSEFTIKIRGNPTTGYGWFLDNPKKLDGSSVQPLNLNDKNSADFKTDDHPEGFVGVGGYYLFKFKAVGEANSQVNLNFVMKRPWEETNERQVTVTVSLS